MYIKLDVSVKMQTRNDAKSVAEGRHVQTNGLNRACLYFPRASSVTYYLVQNRDSYCIFDSTELLWHYLESFLVPGVGYQLV